MTDLDFSVHLGEALNDHSRRRRYAQNRVIVDTAVSLNKALDASGLSQKELAERLEKSEGFISQVLSGGTNMTLRTLGDFAFALDCVVSVSITPTSSTSLMGRTSWRGVEVESLPTDNQYVLAA